MFNNMTTQDLIGLIGLVFAFFSTIATVVMAIATIYLYRLGKDGLEQWRKELKGKDQYDLAQKIARLTYQFKLDFDFLRTPETFDVEVVHRPKVDSETIEQVPIYDKWHVKSTRFERLRDTAIKLEEASWEAETTLEEPAIAACKKVVEIFYDVGTIIHPFFESWLEVQQQLGAIYTNDVPPYMKEAYNKLYASSEDAYGKAIKALRASLKTYTIVNQ